MAASPPPMLARFTAWANEVLYEALAQLPQTESVKKQRIVFGSLLRTLNHVYAIDLVWQAHLQNRPHAFVSHNPGICPPFVELRAATEEMVDFQFIGGGSGSLSRGDIVLQVINHTTYHRGHIGDMMFQTPVHPPSTDLPVYRRNVARAP